MGNPDWGITNRWGSSEAAVPHRFSEMASDLPGRDFCRFPTVSTSAAGAVDGGSGFDLRNGRPRRLHGLLVEVVFDVGGQRGGPDGFAWLCGGVPVDALGGVRRGRR